MMRGTHVEQKGPYIHTRCSNEDTIGILQRKATQSQLLGISMSAASFSMSGDGM